MLGHCSCRILALVLSPLLLSELVIRPLLLSPLYYGRPPSHLRGGTAVFDTQLIEPAAAAELRALFRRVGLSDDGIPSNVSPKIDAVNTASEHIGEAQPIGADGMCSHPYLVPNAARTLCVLAGRIDLGRHYLLTGGVEGRRERYSQLVARLLSFGTYTFDLEADDAAPVRRCVALKMSTVLVMIMHAHGDSAVIALPSGFLHLPDFKRRRQKFVRRTANYSTLFSIISSPSSQDKLLQRTWTHRTLLAVAAQPPRNGCSW